MSTPRHGRNRDCACDSLPRVKRHLVWIKSKCVLSGYVVSWKSVTIEEDESDPETRVRKQDNERRRPFHLFELFHTVSPVVFDPETRHGIIKDFVDTREGAASKKTN